MGRCCATALARDAALAERQRQLVGLRAGMFLCGLQRTLAKGTGWGGWGTILGWRE